jgi:hypothetical protein
MLLFIKAIANGFDEIVKILLDNKAKIEDQKIYGESAIIFGKQIMN